MSFVGLFGKRTWLGLAAAVATLLLWIMLGALLIVKEALPFEAAAGWIYGGCGLAAFLGGCAARKNGGETILALITATLLYALLWGVALASSQPLDFHSHGLWITGAVLGGGLLSGLLRKGRKRKKQVKRQAPATVKRRKRAVT